MTGDSVATHRCHPRVGGDPVRRGFSVHALRSLEYWIVRPSAQLRTRRTMTTECEFTISRRIASELCIKFPVLLFRGRREDRVLAAPAVSRAICANKTAHEHTGQREHSGLPCAMALRLTSCSPRRTALLPPSPRRKQTLRSLTPAPRRPNHTTSPYASGAYVYRALSVHRISPHVRDDRERPSSAVRRAELCD